MEKSIEEFLSRPAACPVCGSPKVADILYGLPVFDEQLKKELEEGKVVLSGCEMGGDDPEWVCKDCGAEIYFGHIVKTRK